LRQAGRLAAVIFAKAADTKYEMSRSGGIGFINWRGERKYDGMERFRLLLGGMVGANTRRGPGIRDQIRESRRQLRNLSGFTATLCLGLAGMLFLTASRPAAATGLYRQLSRALAERLTTPVRSEPSVRLVHETADYEEYSNGLVVTNTWRSPGKPRPSYPVFPAAPGGAAPEDWRIAPAGIVYHSTESHPLPMEAEWQPDVPRIEKYLLDYVRDKHLYHFLIDRTGRVFRIVPESDIANHAGKSVWGDDRNVYVNLNASFLGIAFEREAHNRGARVTEDQLQSARLLTDMLRAKYDIPAENCVTHAQVSVNPGNMIIGAHTDWAGDFPFEELGLGNNYAQPFASMLTFGFDYDGALVSAAGNRTWKGLLDSEQRIRERASQLGVSVSQYRAELQKRYRDIVATLDSASATT
jgi:hypothetical protein